MTRRPHQRTAPLPLVGWLFADLMLLLAIVGFGQGALGEPEAAAKARPRAVATPLPSKPPPATAKAHPIGVSQTAIVVRFGVPTARLLAGDKAALQDLNTHLAKALAPLKGQRAGIVLTFGVDPNDVRALALSTLVNAHVRQQAPSLTDGALLRDFVDLSGSDVVKIEIYLFTK